MKKYVVLYLCLTFSIIFAFQRGGGGEFNDELMRHNRTIMCKNNVTHVLTRTVLHFARNLQTKYVRLNRTCNFIRKDQTKIY